MEANQRAESIDLRSIEEPTESEDGEDAAGFLDKVATAETTLPEWKDTLEAIGRDIELIGQIMREAAEDISKGSQQGKGFAARLTVARRASQRLVEPVDRIWSFGNDFATQLHQVDEGFRTIIERAAVEVEENSAAKDDVCQFFDMVRALSESAHEGLGAIQGMLDSIAPVEALSRDLRPPLRRLRQGLTVMVEAREVTDDWVSLIENTGIDCQQGGPESEPASA